jgi:hypothetical protein
MFVSLVGIPCKRTSRSTKDVRAVSSAGRAPALQAGGRRFDPVTAHGSTKPLALGTASGGGALVDWQVRARELDRKSGCHWSRAGETSGRHTHQMRSVPNFGVATLKRRSPRLARSSRFRQNATATHSVVVSGMGESGQSPAVGSIALGLHVDAIDTFRASRRVGRADASSSWPAVEGSVRFDVSRRRCARRVLRFDVSRRRCARRAYVSTFRGDVAAAPWRAAALSGRGGDISPAGGGTLGEARWRSRRGMT